MKPVEVFDLATVRRIISNTLILPNNFLAQPQIARKIPWFAGCHQHLAEPSALRTNADLLLTAVTIRARASIMEKQQLGVGRALQYRGGVRGTDNGDNTDDVGKRSFEKTSDRGNHTKGSHNNLCSYADN